jgi:hypothetical protein
MWWLKGDAGVASKLQVTPAECRRRGAECHKMAENAPSPHVRDTLAEIERMWNRLAVGAEVSEAMLTRFLGGAAFGPDEIAIMVAAYEGGLTQINASGHNDPAAETLAQAIVMLAKRGERDPIRLEQHALEVLSGQPPVP